MRVSIIIPTYNHQRGLKDLLDKLDREDYPRQNLEVIVVDDGSSDETSEVLARSYSYPLCSLYQNNQGDAVARNLGCQKARGELLLFIDDDCRIGSGLIRNMVNVHGGREKVIVIGNLLPEPPADATPFGGVFSLSLLSPVKTSSVSFTECSSALFCIRRDDYLNLGMMTCIGTEAGSNIWCDVEFAYRAHLEGFQFERQGGAKSFHQDKHLLNLNTYCRRSLKVARVAVILFSQHPRLINELQVFTDKLPIDLKTDSWGLITRKVLRRVSASNIFLRLLEALAWFVERCLPKEHLLRPLYNWVVGGYLFCGVRQGLREFGVWNRSSARRNLKWGPMP